MKNPGWIDDDEYLKQKIENFDPQSLLDLASRSAEETLKSLQDRLPSLSLVAKENWIHYYTIAVYHTLLLNLENLQLPQDEHHSIKDSIENKTSIVFKKMNSSYLQFLGELTSIKSQLEEDSSPDLLYPESIGQWILEKSFKRKLEAHEYPLIGPIGIRLSNHCSKFWEKYITIKKYTI